MKLTALDSFDLARSSVKAGDPIEVGDREGAQLIQRGLAKMGPPVENKMAPTGENKADPSAAGGEARPSSALPAARASAQTTVNTSGNGEKLTPAQKAAATRAANRAAKAGE